MGACGEEKKSSNNNNNNKKIQLETNEDKISEKDIKAIEETEKEVFKSIPKPKKNYTIKFINEEKNDEFNDTIDGDITLNQILINMRTRNNSDFILEFSNGAGVGPDKKEENFDKIIEEIYNNNEPEIVKMKYIYKGLDITENAIQSYIENNTIIGNAILDNTETFGIITYDTNNKSLNSFSYKRSEYPELTYLTIFTAYCNAKNCLYFSGGEKEMSYENEEISEKYNEFFCLDLTELKNNENQLILNQIGKLNDPRTWHSMIYVPNKYIFIVGGSNTKLVELYDIEQKKLTKDSELNEIRCECTLCLVNNMYLYAFCGFIPQKDYNNSIERCNLFKENRSWEKIDTIERCKIKFNPSFFAISYYQNNDLILIGGNDQGEAERADYIYKIAKEENEKDEIEEYKFDLQDKVSIFKDKLFVPTLDNKAINIPLIIADEIKVVIFDRENGEVNTNDF
jgi:hypothetical protein